MTGPPGPDDAALIAESLERPDVFADLYGRHAADIHRYAARRLGDAAADDITADTFLTAFRHPPSRPSSPAPSTSRPAYTARCCGPSPPFPV